MSLATLALPPRRLWRVPRDWFTAVALAIPLGCVLDTQLSLGEAQQWLLAIPVWWVVLSVLGELPRAQRVTLLCFLPLIALGELALSHGLGWYVYRLENLPPWIVPAHGIVFLTALRVVDLPAPSTRVLAWGAAGAQALYGVANLLLRGDEVGALLSLVYVIGMIVLPAEGKRFYAVLGIVVAYLEVIGSALGVWVWAPVLFGLAEANPPSGAVGGYAMIDGAAWVLATLVIARVTAGRPLASRSPA
jgi:hypothetical protein